MKTILDTDNIFEYLATRGFCKKTDRETSKITFIQAKNFNVLINFSSGKSLLVKQEIHDCWGNSKREFWSAWRINQLIKTHSSFDDKIRDSLPEILYFDFDNSILLIHYLDDHIDLSDYYAKENQFLTTIPTLIGKLIAAIHSQTFQRKDYQDFLSNFHIKASDIGTVNSNILRQNLENSYAPLEIIHRLSRITPQIFRIMPQECLQFFKLYQRFPSLAQAVLELGHSINASCLVHNDLKLNNILLNLDWKYSESNSIKIIDWERADWGDPAFDLGSILCSYLEIWLDGLIVSSTLSINESLQLATTPLERLQPTLSKLVESYLESFPEIIIIRPDYLNRVIQFTGLCLIERVEIMIDEARSFGNRGIVMLQVAKQLICNPQVAMSTLFGNNIAQKVHG